MTDTTDQDAPGGIFRGFRRPNYTMVPDELFDDLLAVLTGVELKVLLYIVRRTFGFKKDSDNISLSQMLNGVVKQNGTRLDSGCGISKPSLLRALKSLKDQNIIIAEQRESAEKGSEATNYRLNVLTENATPPGSFFYQGGSQNFTRPVVKKFAPQETVLQETNNVDSNEERYSESGGTKSTDFKELEPGDQKLAIQPLLEKVEGKLGDTHSTGFYTKILLRLYPNNLDIFERALGMAAEQQNVRVSRGALFTALLKKFARERGINLYLRQKEMPATGPEIDEAEEIADEAAKPRLQRHEIISQYAIDPATVELWEQTLGRLRLDVSRPIFDTWMKGTLLLPPEDGVYTILTQNLYGKEVLETRFEERIGRFLAEGGATAKQIKFEVAKPTTVE